MRRQQVMYIETMKTQLQDMTEEGKGKKSNTIAIQHEMLKITKC